MTLTDQVIKSIIKRLIMSQDYRVEVLAIINADFLQYVLDFFKKIVDAKLAKRDISVDWYKEVFLDDRLSPDDIAIHAGLNKKTIHNMFNSATKQIVLDASLEQYDTLCQSIQCLIDQQNEVDLTLTIKFRGVSVDLNINESLIVINSLAVKRASIRGGAWSTAGKRIEKLLMDTLCRLFNVPQENFIQVNIPESRREIDFCLTDNDNEKYRCEVKLMGAGNPESADAIFARASEVFVADKLSDSNKRQAKELKIKWVELRSPNGYKRFGEVLTQLGIPHREFDGNLEEVLDKILDEKSNMQDFDSTKGLSFCFQ